jgi:hypothetical protein
VTFMEQLRELLEIFKTARRKKINRRRRQEKL